MEWAFILKRYSSRSNMLPFVLQALRQEPRPAPLQTRPSAAQPRCPRSSRRSRRNLPRRSRRSRRSQHPHLRLHLSSPPRPHRPPPLPPAHQHHRARHPRQSSQPAPLGATTPPTATPATSARLPIASSGSHPLSSRAWTLMSPDPAQSLLCPSWFAGSVVICCFSTTQQHHPWHAWLTCPVGSSCRCVTADSAFKVMRGHATCFLPTTLSSKSVACSASRLFHQTTHLSIS